MSGSDGATARQRRRLKILHLNVQGLGGKCEDLSLLLSEYSVDVACFSEHWQSSDEILYCSIDGYTLISFYSRTRHQRGGVCVYVRQGVESESVACSLNSEIDFECAVATIFSQELKRKMCVMAVYRSPDGDLTGFLDGLESALNEAFHRNYYYHFICGDVNVDFLKESKDKNHLENLLSSYGIRPQILKPTRIQGVRETCIDNLFCDLDALSDVVGPYGLSDHHFQVCEFNVSCEDVGGAQNVLRRNFSQRNVHNFTGLLSSVDWATDPDLSFNAKFDIFYNKFIEVYNCCFPLRVLKEKMNYQRPYWFTPPLKQLRSFLYDMSLIAKSINNPDYNNRYRKLRQFYKKSIKNAKRAANNVRVGNAKNVTKECWRIVKEAKKGSRHSIECIHDAAGDRLIDNKKEICDYFNSYFLNLSTNNRQPDFASGNLVPPFHASFFLTPTTACEILELIDRVTSSPAPGSDDIHGRMLREAGPLIAGVLSDLINESFLNGEYPDSLKESRSFPIYKNKGSKTDAGNYRIVAVQSQVAKVFELAYYNRLAGFLEHHKILSSCQNAFRKNKSTISAITDVTAFIYDGLNERKYLAGLFYDLRRAFDTVDQNLLCHKLQCIGVRGQPHDWIRSYLINRSQRVVVGGVESCRGEVSSGVPQGTILAPLLFIAFINDLATIFQPSVKVSLYADDTNVVVAGSSESDLVHNCNEASRAFAAWCSSNALDINVDKTQFVRFLPRNVSPDYSLLLSVSHRSIVQVERTSFLGIVLDQKLTMEHQVEHTCAKINSSCYLMRSLRGTVSPDVLRVAYFGVVQSVLAYGLLVWGSATNFGRAFGSQKRVIRCMAGAHLRAHCAPLFKKFKILTLPSLYIYQLVDYILKNKQHYTKGCEVHNYTTRRCSDLRLPYSRLTVGQGSHIYQGIKCFNKMTHILDPNSELSTKTFRAAMKRFLTDSAFYSVADFLVFKA